MSDFKPLPDGGCHCAHWAREADDTLRAHHPNCIHSNNVPEYVSILQMRDAGERNAALCAFMVKHYPTAYYLLTEEAR